MNDYRFAIGDYVRMLSYQPVSQSGRKYICFRVISRELDECPGGVQRKYTLRNVQQAEVVVQHIHEFELEPWTDADEKAANEREWSDYVRGLSDEALAMVGLCAEAEYHRRKKEREAEREAEKAEGKEVTG